MQNEVTIADAEGTEVPPEQVKASVIQAVVRFRCSSLLNTAIIENFTQDSSREAAQAEADVAESTENKAEADREQIEKPHAEPEGTAQDT